MDDIEPMFILYADENRDEGATLDEVLQALVKLVNLGFSKCRLEENNRIGRVCQNLTVDDLKRRFAGQPEKEQKEYPDVPEYYFEITEKGRQEEAKEMYEEYYPT